MGTTNCIVNGHEKGFCQENLTKEMCAHLYIECQTSILLKNEIETVDSLKLKKRRGFGYVHYLCRFLRRIRIADIDIIRIATRLAATAKVDGFTVLS